MKVVYPPNEHLTYEASSFLLGCVAPGAQLLLNGDPVTVSEHGYFSLYLPLQPGENRLELEERLSETVTDKQTMLVKREAAVELTDAASQSEVILAHAYPMVDIGLRPGEPLFLYCMAPPDVTVTCQVESINSRQIEMTPLPDAVPDNRVGCFGMLHQLEAPWPQGVLYTAHIRIPDDAPPLPNLWVKYTFRQDGQEWTTEAQGTVTVLPLGKKQYARVKTREAIVRTLPFTGARLTPLGLDTLVEITGFHDTAFRVQYTPHQSVWIDKTHLEMLEHLVYPVPVTLHLIRAEMGLNGLEITLPMPYRVPWQVQLAPDCITLDLYQTASQCDFIHYGPGAFDNGLEAIEVLTQENGMTRVCIRLNSPLMGFLPHFADQELTLTVRTRKSLENSPFVVVLDPGHGGDETGAIALDGTPEKELNLIMARKIQGLLAGDITVVLTRDSDEEVSLNDRVERAIAADGNLLISLHHNALPDGRMPLAEKGLASFYYYPFALPLAQTAHEALVQQSEFSDYGVLYDSLHMCRVMEMPALLLELGFLIHPEDVVLCLDPVHQDRIAQAIAQAIQSLSPYARSR